MKGKITVLVEEINNFSDGHLKRKDDLAVLINLCYSEGNERMVDEISFTSKYVQGLFRVLNRGTSNQDVQNIALIKRDISTNLEKIREKIEQIILNSEIKVKQYFRENYLQLSQDNLLNLMELINDLEWTKKYLNYLKRKNSN